MSKDLYQSLFVDGSGPDKATDLVRGFVQAARLHRAAHDLATDEMLEGIWVEEELSVDEDVRLAADDRSTTRATYTGGEYTVEIAVESDGTWSATQRAGASGASLRFGDAWVVLTDGEPAAVPVSALPDEVVLVDLHGREITLRR